VTDADLISNLQRWGRRFLTITYEDTKIITNPTYIYTKDFDPDGFIIFDN
jgi:hypothetical protein